MSEVRKCKISGKEFKISDADVEFYEKIGVPLPTISPEERERRRLVWRNERHLYRRNCGLCKKTVIAIYPEDVPFPIYCEQCFWSNKWDPLKYGRDFEFDRPFFEQLAELAEVVPRLAITHANSVNSDYTLNSVNNRNCYLTSGADYNENCMYGIASQRSRNCVDHFLIYDSEFCYGCLDCSRLYNCTGCQECEDLHNSWFLYDCKNCRNCAFSSNLRGSEYVLFNRQLSKDDYTKQLSMILAQLFENPDWMDESRKRVREKAVHRHALILDSENSSGNYVRGCRNSFNIFDSEDLCNCKYAYYAADLRDSYDVSCVTFQCHDFYEVMSACNGYNVKFCDASLYCHDLEYCITCFNSSFLLGCISMNNNHQYVIMNKQYTPDQFKKIRDKIIEYMKTTGEYGEYFPPWLSPFGYNESSAMDYMPLTKEDANEKGFLWYDDIEAFADQENSQNHQCNSCKQNYTLIKQETDFYEKMRIPYPNFCWPCRLRLLIESRKPWQLYDNRCTNCDVLIKTPIAPERPEKVYCDECYQEKMVKISAGRL